LFHLDAAVHALGDLRERFTRTNDMRERFCLLWLGCAEPQKRASEREVSER
jgi:hypothetical protein